MMFRLTHNCRRKPAWPKVELRYLHILLTAMAQWLWHERAKCDVFDGQARETTFVKSRRPANLRRLTSDACWWVYYFSSYERHKFMPMQAIFALHREAFNSCRVLLIDAPFSTTGKSAWPCLMMVGRLVGIGGPDLTRRFAH